MRPLPVRLVLKSALAFLALSGYAAAADGVLAEVDMEANLGGEVTRLPFAPGERVDWEVRFAGVKAGYAWAEVRAAAADRVWFVAGCRSAPWYERIYKIDDLIESTWDPAAPGSSRYWTRFREGGFHQDQDMDIRPDGIRIQRRQEYSDGWREWVDELAGYGQAVEDPQSAFHRIRTLPLVAGESYQFPIFSGRRTWMLEVKAGASQVLDTALGSRSVIPVQLKTRHEGDLEQKGDLLILISDDGQRIPLRLVLQTNIGAIRADIIAYRAGPAPPVVEPGGYAAPTGAGAAPGDEPDPLP